MPHERHGERGLQARRIFVRIPDPTMPKLVASLSPREAAFNSALPQAKMIRPTTVRIAKFRSH